MVVIPQGEQRLRVQGRGHVDAGVIVISAFQPYIFGAGIGAHAFQKSRKGHPTPFTDGAPTLHANQACDLTGLR
ncbi:hypothetical protein D9M71_788330 [compost metagenome]